MVFGCFLIRDTSQASCACFLVNEKVMVMKLIFNTVKFGYVAIIGPANF